MKNAMQFDFLVDKENNTMTIKREFAAGQQLVWDCHTKQELLNRWFAPAPFTTKTVSMDFKDGGHWVYGMIDPAGPTYYGRMDYQKINPISGYTLLDAFCDEKGTINTDMPRASWDVTFQSKGENTIVQTIVKYASLEALETVVNMGMKEGMTSTMDKLDELLATLKK